MFLLALIMKNSPRYVSYFFSLIAGLAFILLAIFTNTNVSQDRLQYFNNYIVADFGEFNIATLATKDGLFHLFLEVLPGGLTLAEFTTIISLITFLLFVKLIKTFEFKRVFQKSHFPYIVMIALSDRLVMDAFFNTMRSSWALMIFFLGVGLTIGQRYRLFQTSWFVSLLTHMGASIFAIINYIMYILARRFLFVIIYILIFFIIFRIYTGQSLVPYSILGDFFYQFTNFNFISVDRATTYTSNINVKLSALIFLSIVLPMLITLYRRGVRFIIDDFLFGYLVFFSLVIILLYLDLSLTRRFFVIPIIGFLFFLSYKDLQVLAIFKLLLFLGFSYNFFSI